MAKSKTRQDPTCSFCQRPTAEAGQLLAGPPGVFICKDCSVLCLDMFGKVGKAPDAPAAPASRKEAAKEVGTLKVPKPHEI